MDEITAIRRLFGKGKGRSVTMLTGKVTGTSSDGEALVDLGGDTITEDGDQSIPIPTSPHVDEGDYVLVMAGGRDPVAPVVIGAVGSGDKVAAEVAQAREAAGEAGATAQAASAAAGEAVASAGEAQAAAGEAEAHAQAALASASSAMAAASAVGEQVAVQQGQIEDAMDLADATAQAVTGMRQTLTSHSQSITDLTSVTASHTASIQTTANGLSSVVDRVTATEGTVGTLRTDVEAAQTAADAAQGSADSAASAASTAQAAADAAQGSADSAQAAADAARQAADAAQEGVDSLRPTVLQHTTSIAQNSEQIALRATKVELRGTYDRLKALGDNLVVGGYGELGLDGFDPALSLDAADRVGGASGSFVVSGSRKFLLRPGDLVPFDAGKTYTLSYHAKCSLPDINQYDALSCFDVDGKEVQVHHCNFVPGTTTTLAQPLSPGDTTVRLASAAGWAVYPPEQDHKNGLIFWDYADSTGHAYPPETYSRDVTDKVLSSVDAAAGTLTLSAPWAGPAKPAGTPVSQRSSGATRAYGRQPSYVLPAGTWTRVTDTWSGVGGVKESGKVWHGTAYIAPSFLANWSGPGAAGATLKLCAVSLTTAADAGDLTALKGRVTTAESSITQTAQSITSQVSNTISQTRQELSTAIASGDASVRSDLAAGDQAVRDDLDEAVTDLGQQIAAGDQQVTQALSSSITQTAQSITSLITQGGDQTMMRVYSDGVLVGRVGAQICVLVNASGSVDIVRVSWSGSSPSSVTMMSRFDDDEVMLGADRSIVSLAGTLTISGSAGWDPDSGITGSHTIHASPPVMRWLSSAKKNGAVRNRRLGFSGLDANGLFEYKASDMSQVATGNADILIKALGALSNEPPIRTVRTTVSLPINQAWGSWYISASRTLSISHLNLTSAPKRVWISAWEDAAAQETGADIATALVQYTTPSEISYRLTRGSTLAASTTFTVCALIMGS